MKSVIHAADLFAGAGGASTGLARACERVGRRLNLIAVNHWPTAVETHRQNHPEAVHLCEAIESVNPRQAVPGGKLDLLLAGPSCTHHSTARGGKPVNDQQRASAWCILRWATDLDIKTILIENVREFQSWGPIGSDGRPLKSRKGETFRAFVHALISLGYRVEWKVLNAADYGGATTRERLFIQCQLGRRRVGWPRPSHAPRGGRDLFGALKPWRPAREIIDWAIPMKSIFGRKKPLSPNTIARIAAGLRKFGGKAAAPFLVLLRGTESSQIASSAKSIDGPVPTLTTGRNVGLCEPFIVPTNYGERPGQSPRCHDLGSPLPTVVESVVHALVQPFIATVTHAGWDETRVRSIDQPLSTVTAGGVPFLMQMSQSGSNGDRVRPLSAPVPTVTTADDMAICEPFLTRYNNNRPDVCARPLGEPLPAVDCNDRYGLVVPGYQGVLLDIRFRMLQPHELAAAMGFPASYVFTGNREQRVKQIGNAWECELSEKLCLALLEAA